MNRELPKCPLCGYAAIEQYFDGQSDLFRVNCKRCGRYSIHRDSTEDHDIIQLIQDNHGLLSGITRESTEASRAEVVIDNRSLHQLIASVVTLTVDEKCLKIFAYIKQNTSNIGVQVDLMPDHDYPLAYATNADEFRAIIKILKDHQYIEVIYSTGLTTVRLTKKGWDHDIMNNLNLKSINEQTGPSIHIGGDVIGSNIAAGQDIVQTNIAELLNRFIQELEKTTVAEKQKFIEDINQQRDNHPVLISTILKIMSVTADVASLTQAGVSVLRALQG